MPRTGILRRPILLLPLAVVVLVGVSFFRLLERMRSGRYNPHKVPNLLVGHVPPPFTATPAPPGKGFTAADLQNLPAPVLINFFASWCVPCHAEHALLMQLRSRGVAVWGIAYEDSADAMQTFLSNDGDPYRRLGADSNGEAAVAWGISGVPESFLVDRQGIIRWHIGGPLSEEVVKSTLMPLLRKYA